jgi:hypothetical protein
MTLSTMCLSIPGQTSNTFLPNQMLYQIFNSSNHVYFTPMNLISMYQKFPNYIIQGTMNLPMYTCFVDNTLAPQP